MATANTESIRAEIVLPSKDLKDDLPFFTKTLGFRLDNIYPSDDPAVAVLSGHGLQIRLERGASAPPGRIRILCDEPATFAQGIYELVAPNGTRIEIAELNPAMATPPTRHAFIVRRLKDGAPWVIGRAGMHYRDLLPGRLGGSIIASHIRIPDGGPVPDVVHYHTVGFQLIFCYRGWVRLVYEDQGPPFILHAGDCVIQPPEIRHRVLEASENVEVIEIGVPAEHMTTIDHEMELPNDRINTDRIFGGQKFCRHEVKKALWQTSRLPGLEFRETGIGEATGGVASVHVLRNTGAEHTAVNSHNSDILFTFVMEGSMSLRGQGQSDHQLEPGDAFVVPPGMKTCFIAMTPELELLEVTLPAKFDTVIHTGGI